MIQINAASKTFGTRIALHATTLHLANNQTHVFWGSSGSGKTTLLRLIAGLADPTTGEIWIQDQKVSSEIQSRLATKIGYVIQEGGLFPHLTAWENIALAGLPQRWSAQRIQQRINDLANLVQLEVSILKQYPKQLSGGQRQRVALMRALFLDPPIILLDEPLGALDPLVRSDLQKELKVIFNGLKKTVIIVTHDIGEGAFFGHTLSLFHEGHLVQHGDFKSFIDTPNSEFVTKFITAQIPPAELLAVTK
jgi:osmoprotectant transport system ATP-binding protein